MDWLKLLERNHTYRHVPLDNRERGDLATWFKQKLISLSLSTQVVSTGKKMYHCCISNDPHLRSNSIRIQKLVDPRIYILDRELEYIKG